MVSGHTSERSAQLAATAWTIWSRQGLHDVGRRGCLNGREVSSTAVLSLSCKLLVLRKLSFVHMHPGLRCMARSSGGPVWAISPPLLCKLQQDRHTPSVWLCERLLAAAISRAIGVRQSGDGRGLHARVMFLSRCVCVMLQRLCDAAESGGQVLLVNMVCSLQQAALRRFAPLASLHSPALCCSVCGTVAAASWLQVSTRGL